MPAAPVLDLSACPSAPREVRHKGKLHLADVLDGLVASGWIAADVAAQFKHARRYFQGEAHPLSQISEQQWRLPSSSRPLDLEALTQWLAAWSGLPYYSVDPLKINFAAVTEVMSSAYATRFRILPVEVGTESVTIATSEPFQRNWEAEIQRLVRKEIRVVVANPEEIARYQVEFYSFSKSVRTALQRGDVANSGLANFEQLVELGKTEKNLDANDHHIVRLVDWLWQYAFEQNASDIHLEPRREAGSVRFRIDGILHAVYQLPMPVMNAMTSRIKILGRMDVVEKRRPQDGRIKTRLPDGEEVELRLSTLPTAFGEKLVMRIFDPNVLLRDFAALGFGEDERTQWETLTRSPNGIILVTGPTGSGKTTTLYTTLKQLATPEVNLCTLEDPIEMIEPAFNQTQVQSELQMGFAEGIRALLRQDPDIIMVGEIRDLETAEMAIQAALTGHLVLSTLHTSDAVTAVTRLLDLGVPAFQLHATLLGVMAQRLVRTLCPKCKTLLPVRPADSDVWQTLIQPWQIKLPEKLYYPSGCLDCRMTGYHGRMGLYEILPLHAKVKQAIQAQSDLVALRQAAWQAGMRPMRIAGALKVFAGLTSMEEIIKVVPMEDMRPSLRTP